MSRIDCGRRSGDEVETVVGILLCRRYEHAERISAAQGDDGLDVIVRNDDGWTIFQVKKHTTQPNTDQRYKIRKSLEKAEASTRSSGTSVTRWHLIAPVNLNPRSLAWFTEMTGEAGFPCTWSGLDFLDGLAAEFPDVIDYYFRDGKERLATAMNDLVRALNVRPGGTIDDPRDINIASVLAGAASAHTVINKFDPHFRYDFSVDSRMLPPTQDPGVIFAESIGIAQDQFVTIRMFEKYRGALQDRPITFSLHMRARDAASESAVRDFLDFGAPLSIADGSAEMRADVPGGLGGSLSGNLRLLPRGGPRSNIRIRVSDSSNTELQVVNIEMSPATRGIDGQNIRSIGTSSGGAFEFELRFHDDKKLSQFTFAPLDITGKHPIAIVADLRFLRSLTPSNWMQMGRQYGPFEPGSIAITIDGTKLVPDHLMELIESIAALQDYTTEQLRIPDLSSLAHDDAQMMITAAKLLRGETVDVSLDSISFVPNSSPLPEGPQALLITTEFGVDVAGTTIDVGKVSIHAPAVQLIPPVVPDELPTVRSLEGQRLTASVRRMAAD